MTKTINEETDLRLLGLLTYLSLNKDENGFVCLGCRELSRRIGMSEKWVRTAVKKLDDYKVLKMQPSAPSSAPSSAPNKDENKSTLRSCGNITDEIKAKETKSRRK